MAKFERIRTGKKTAGFVMEAPQVLRHFEAFSF
jgi:hypothetical protein